MLADSPIGEIALVRRDLLVDGVKHKKVFYDAAYAHYDACLVGLMRLLPEDPAFLAANDPR